MFHTSDMSKICKRSPSCWPGLAALSHVPSNLSCFWDLSKESQVSQDHSISISGLLHYTQKLTPNGLKT